MKTSEKVYLVYPEKRWVSVATIRGWYHDACANGDIADEFLGQPDHDWTSQAAALEDAGLITLGKWS